MEAKGLTLPEGVVLPSSIQQSLEQGAMQAQHAGKNRESVQRKQMWWLPYVA